MASYNFYNCSPYAFNFEANPIGYVTSSGLSVQVQDSYVWKNPVQISEVNFSIFGTYNDSSAISGRVVNASTGIEVPSTFRTKKVGNLVINYDCVLNTPLPAQTELRFFLQSSNVNSSNMWINIGYKTSS